jgi:undecaprenyl-diphosphatase
MAVVTAPDAVLIRRPSPVAVTAVASAALLVGLTAWAAADPTTPWTDDVAAHAPRTADAPLDRAALELTRATAPLGNALAVIAVVGWLALRARRRSLAVVAIATASSGILLGLIQLALDADRPVADPLGPDQGSGFPSGHATGWAALAGALALVVPRGARVPVATAGGLLVLAIGASRVHLGAHDPRDVLAGFALGVACAAGAAWALGSRARAR